MTQATLVERLREVAGLKVGTVRQPEWMKPNDWGPAVSELCGEAADEIERLQAGVGALAGKAREVVDAVAEVGKANEALGMTLNPNLSLADIRKELKRRAVG